MKTTNISFAGEWYVHWQGPGYPEKWMNSDDPGVFIRMQVYAESSGNGLDARLESLGLGEDWAMHGQYDTATRVWTGRWWAAQSRTTRPPTTAGVISASRWISMAKPSPGNGITRACTPVNGMDGTAIKFVKPTNALSR